MGVKTDHTHRQAGWDLKKAWESKQTTHRDKLVWDLKKAWESTDHTETNWVGPEEGVGVKTDHTQRQAGWDLKKA